MIRTLQYLTITLHELCRKGITCDKTASRKEFEVWTNWLEELLKLNKLRCVWNPRVWNTSQKSAPSFLWCIRIWLWCAVSNLRIVDEHGKIYCFLLIGKSRLMPIKTITISPVGIIECNHIYKVRQIVTRWRLEVEDIQDLVFWTDSQLILQYIKNEKKRFHMFEANCVSIIDECSSPGPWWYMNTSRH